MNHVENKILPMEEVVKELLKQYPDKNEELKSILINLLEEYVWYSHEN